MPILPVVAAAAEEEEVRVAAAAAAAGGRSRILAVVEVEATLLAATGSRGVVGGLAANMFTYADSGMP